MSLLTDAIDREIIDDLNAGRAAAKTRDEDRRAAIATV